MTSVAKSLSPRFKTRPSASFFIVWLAFFLSACDPGHKSVTAQGETMGTSYHVTLVAGDVHLPEDWPNRIQQVLDEVDHHMSTYRADSELNRLNAYPLAKPMKISPQLLEVLALSRQIYRQTLGAFDPTVGPLVDLWGFGPTPRDYVEPDVEEIDKLRRKLGFDAVKLDLADSTAVRSSTVSLDLSAIAKGYAVDKVAELLSSLGVSRYMVEVGGEIVVSGLNDRGTPWRIAIEKPTIDGRDIQQVLALTSGGIATSGDYRNYFEHNGKRFSHTIDPRTGYPIDHDLASVTVIDKSCAQADALATAFMVMGAETTLAIAEERGLAVLVVTKVGDNFHTAYSSSFKPYLQEIK